MLIPYSKQSINKKDVQAVSESLQDNFLTQGDKVKKFEKNISTLVKSKYVTVVNSATSALYIACRALNLKKNDEVWTSSNTFVATASAVIHCGLKIKFLDINKNGNICICKLKEELFRAKKKNKLPKAIIIVHFAGLPCYPIEIYSLSKRYNFKIIEDASHALGSYYQGIPIGSCKHSDMCIFSFHAIKSITTGEGGCVTTNKIYYEKELKKLRSHGITRDYKSLKRKENRIFHWYYEVNNISFNFRLTDFQCALGISQLKRLKSFISKRNDIANRYIKKLNQDTYELPYDSKENRSAWHLIVIKVKNGKRNQLYKYLKKNKIISVLNYIPVFMHPFYKKQTPKKAFRETISYFKNAISIPIFFDLSTKQQNFVINKLNKFQ